MTLINYGRIDWEASQEDDRHRNYSVTWFIQDTSRSLGPQQVGNAAGLASIGASWTYGGDNDVWAVCTPRMSVTPITSPEERTEYWSVKQYFTTKPTKRERTNEWQNPLDEPFAIRGGFQKYQQEITKDRHNKPIRSSSHELITGNIVQFDMNRPTVQITRNLLSLSFSSIMGIVDTVNSVTMWGLPVRCVKLSNITWERLYTAINSIYYGITYDFDINTKTFDRIAVDRGTKVLSAGGDPDNPEHFEIYKDVNGENTPVLLDGAGNALTSIPAIPPIPNPSDIKIEYYPETNFFLYGVPAVF
jgi:hypothetical protein